MITQAELKQFLFYNPATGDFRWKVARGVATVGALAGCEYRGYRIIRVNKRNYPAHRLAFLYMTGHFVEQVDHKNRKGVDNRWANLRAANSSTNHANQALHKDSHTGFKGVTKRNNYKRWRARIVVRGCEIHLGMFSTPEAAHAAYVKAATRYFGEFARAK